VKKLAIPTTIVILVLLYTRIDVHALLQQLRHMHVRSFCFALLCFIPQVYVTTLRWRWMVGDICPMGTLEATRLILAGKALNAFVPSKLGEMSKAYFLKTRSNLALSRGTALVLLEKVFDVAGLCVVLLAGVLLLPQKGLVETAALLMALSVVAIVICLCLFRISRLPFGRPKRVARLSRRLAALLQGWDEILTRWRRHKTHLVVIIFLSCVLWLFHLLQIYLFFLTLHSTISIRVVFAYVPIGIFVGLLPLTIGGMGTRDSALILLFAPYERPAVMAGVGLLCSLRYWADTLMGLPFFHRYAFDKSR
jgi:uncharacterized protein (TIRG00374 family)